MADYQPNSPASDLAVEAPPEPIHGADEPPEKAGTATGIAAVSYEGEPASDVVEPKMELMDAFMLASVSNPTVNLAHESVYEAQAQQTAADALKLPSLNAGFNFHSHQGNLQRSPGTILNVNSQSLYFGGGARTLAAESVAFPGVRFFYPLADVISEPLAAQHRVVGRQADSMAVLNTTLIEVAAAYMELLRTDAILRELRTSEAELAEIERLTKAFAKAGQGREADAQRAAAHIELLRLKIEAALGEKTAASARLAGILNVDPLTQINPTDSLLSPLDIIDANVPLEILISQAESGRPEMAARISELAETGVRVRQEQIRPWLPTLMAGYSLGGFGGGSNLVPPSFGRFNTRGDFDVVAVWSIQNLGFGNRATIGRNRALSMEAGSRLEDVRARIRSEVTEAQAQVIASATQIETARRQLVTAEEGYQEEAKRTREGIGLPLEVLDSADSLQEARLELVEAVTEYNLSQFRLLTALGTPLAAVPLSAP